MENKKPNKIQLFQEQKVRTHWDEEQEKWYFSVQDVVQILAESKDVKQYIKKMRSRDTELNSNWGTICTFLPMLAADGKMRKIQASDTEGLFRIIQSIPSKKENLRDNMTNLELVLNMLAEASTTEISKEKKPKGLAENKEVARKGGNAAKKARLEIEKQTGKSIVSNKNARQLRITNDKLRDDDENK